MPGGDKLAAVGPFSLDAPRDDFPHPLAFTYAWAWHCAAEAAAIPPRRAWAPAHAYLKAHLHLIDNEHEADFHGDLQRTRGLLRRLCNVDRPSQQEAQDERERRGQEAEAELQARANEIPDLHMLTRTEAEMIWPIFRVDTDAELERYEAYAGDDKTPLADMYWQRVRLRKWRLAQSGDIFPNGLFPAFIVREVAETVKNG